MTVSEETRESLRHDATRPWFAGRPPAMTADWFDRAWSRLTGPTFTKADWLAACAATKAAGS